MVWSIDKDSAWIKVDIFGYRHYCGAVVNKNGRLWIATTVSGDSISGHKTAVEAVSYLKKYDPSFMYFGKFGPHVGTLMCGDVYHRLLPSGTIKDNEGFVFCMPSEGKFPEFLESILTKYLLGVATCVGCSRSMSSLQMQRQPQFDGLCNEQNLYLSCNCGHPVWRMEMNLYSAALIAIRDAMRIPRAKMLKAAGGKHTREEIQAILLLQSNRCIYCNALFTKDRPPSKDHLLPVSSGGSDWALNIVMACNWCNTSRGWVPFRTFCKLLSPKQNERILMQLKQRLLTLDSDHITDDALNCFIQGLALHDPKDGRYLDIQRMRPAARRNAKANRLLPRTVASLLKRASMLEETF